MAGRPQLVQRQAAVGDGTLRIALQALADPVRLRIVRMLRDQEQCVCHLTAALGLSQGTISYHMRLLKQAGLVRDRRSEPDFRWTYYSLEPSGMTALRATLNELLETTALDPTPAQCCDAEGQSGTAID